jgi:GT2 family glycosyltransferase
MKYKKPIISIIIPTINREKFLYQTLYDLNVQKSVLYETIVIDQNTKTDIQFYQNIKKKFKKLNLKLYIQKKSNSSEARNLGVIQSNSEIILFIDDDVRIKSKFFLKNHLDNYLNLDTKIVAGKIIENDTTINNKTFFSLLKNTFYKDNWRFFKLNSNKTKFKFCIGRSANLSVRKKIFLELGGMDNRFIKGAHREETDFLFKAADQNIKIKFDPKSSLVHLKGKQGGIRNFNKYEKTFLEIYGELFFNLKNFKRVEILLSLFILLRKYFITKNSILNPHIFFINIVIFIYSLIFALKNIIKGCNKSFLNKKKVNDILL